MSLFSTLETCQVDIKNEFILYLGDMRSIDIGSRVDLLITEVPKLKSMPQDQIELGLNRFIPKFAVLFSDYNLKLNYPNYQFPWDVYTKRGMSVSEYFINRAIKAGDVVFDPFAGYCNIGKLAIEKQRRFIGIEIQSDIYKIGKEKLNALLRETRIS